MKKILLHILFIVTPIFLFSSCEKEFKIDLATTTNTPVVEGYIENGLPPYLFLTSTFSLFSSLSTADVSKYYIHNAKINITDQNGKVIPLKEYEIKFGTAKIYIYSVKGLDFSGNAAFQVPFGTLGYVGIDWANFNVGDTGKVNSTYRLSIQLEGENEASITATTSILQANGIDSLWVVPRSNSPKDSLVSLYGRIKDNAATKNYIRYFTQRNGEAFLPGYTSVFDDQFTNGSTYEAKIDRGVDKTATADQFKEYGYFKIGDTVTVKSTQIDKPVFDFWQTFEYAYQNLGNPYASPTNIKSNVKGALGVWCGYGSYHPPFYQTIIIK